MHHGAQHSSVVHNVVYAIDVVHSLDSTNLSITELTTPNNLIHSRSPGMCHLGKCLSEKKQNFGTLY